MMFAQWVHISKNKMEQQLSDICTSALTIKVIVVHIVFRQKLDIPNSKLNFIEI